MHDNDKLASLLGCFCVLSTGLLNGVISVQTRMMQSISVLVTVFYVGFVATILTAIWLLIEYASDSDQSQLRILKLDWN